MTNKVDDISEIIQVGDLFKHTWPSSMEDGTTFDTYYQVFAVTKKSVKVAEVNVPKKYDFTKKKLLKHSTAIISKKVHHSIFGTYIRDGQTCYNLAK